MRGHFRCGGASPISRFLRHLLEPQGLRVSKQAVADLSGIRDCTAARWGPRQAERHLDQIRGAGQALAAGAQSGVDAGDVRSGYHRFSVGSHVLFFRVADDGCVEIIRVLHQRMDVHRHL